MTGADADADADAATADTGSAADAADADAADADAADAGADVGSEAGSAAAEAAAADGRARLAAGIRRLTTLVVGRPLGAADLDRAAEQVEQVAQALERLAGPGKAPRALPDLEGGSDHLFPTSPVIGVLNPLSPPVQVWRVTGEGGVPELRGRARFTYAYEGPPTCVHGGVIAEVFDELLGAALLVAGRPGMTGTLTVRYRRPTPLQADIDLVARPTTVEGRKVLAWGGMFYEGELTAEAEGVFVTLSPAHMVAIVNSNAERAGAEVVDGRLRSYIDAGGGILAVE
jgi:acyl-coenzyme A thioesterase PaaI-like protein